MMQHMARRVCALLIAAVLECLVLHTWPASAQTPTTINFWHAMSGSRGKVVEELIKKFNEANKDVQVVATFKGNYAETLTGALAAARAGAAPCSTTIGPPGSGCTLER
jgi:sn-glycerol 3-phosphate transport system substrate-binding protein